MGGKGGNFERGKANFLGVAWGKWGARGHSGETTQKMRLCRKEGGVKKQKLGRWFPSKSKATEGETMEKEVTMFEPRINPEPLRQCRGGPRFRTIGSEDLLYRGSQISREKAATSQS